VKIFFTGYQTLDAAVPASSIIRRPSKTLTSGALLEPGEFE